MYSPETGKLLVERAEGLGCVYNLDRPEDEIADGSILELTDFQNSAQSIGSAAALGTRVFKEAVIALRESTGEISDPNDASVDDPFVHVWRLTANPKGLTIWTKPNILLRLPDFYIQTQPLKDYYDSLTDEQRRILFAEKGNLVVRDVIYDDGEASNS